MNALPMTFDGLHPILDLPVWGLLLLKITAVLSAAWLGHLVLVRANPRWLVLLWRVTAVGLVALPVAAWMLPTLEISVPQPPEIETTTSVASINKNPSADPAGNATIPLGTPYYPPESNTVHFLPTITNNQPSVETPDQAQSPPMQTPVPVEQKSPPIVNWSALLLAVWLGEIVLLGLRLCLGYYRISTQARHAVQAPQAVCDECRRVARAMGWRGGVDVAQSTLVASPFLCGIRRPLLLLPARMCDESYHKDLPGILAHELSHARSHDVLWNACLQLIAVIIWFHPLAWRMRTAHLAACELVSDATSANFVGDVTGYCRTLARVAVETNATMPASGIAMARTSGIGRRLSALKKRVFHMPLRRRSVLAFGMAAFLGVALLGALQFALAAPSPAEFVETAIEKNKVEAETPRADREIKSAATTDSRGSTAVYKFTDLGALPGGVESNATGINSRGQVVGRSATGGPIGKHGSRAFLYDNGKMTDLGTLGGEKSNAIAINDSGQIVGKSDTTEGDSHAFLYSDGKMTDLGTLGGHSIAVDINASGVVVGESATTKGMSRAFVYEDGKMTALEIPDSSYYFARAINAGGQIVGRADILYPSSFDSQPTAFIYSDGKITDLGTIPNGISATPYDINDARQVVGAATYGDDRYRHAFLYSNGKMIDLGTLDVGAMGGSHSEAYGINNRGDVVGESNGRAFIYRDGKMNDLNNMIEPDSNFILMAAVDINDRGQIVGRGCIANGDIHAFLLTPVSVKPKKNTEEHPTSNNKANSSTNEAKMVFQTAMKEIENNYKNLRTVVVTYEQLHIDPSVDRRKKVEGKTGKGTHFSTTVAPIHISRRAVTIEGDNLRAESYERVGNDWNHSETMVRKGGEWTTFARNSNFAQRKPAEHLGSLFPLDPRDFGGLDQRYGLLEQMRRSEAKGFSRTGGIAEVVAEIVNRPRYGYQPEQRFTYLFDTRRNYLPRQVIRHYPDGSINVLSELSYEEVAPGKSWYVRELSQKYFAKAVAKNPDSNGWHQLLVFKAVGPIRVNEDLSDDFEIDFPPGVKIR
ncbi:MAG: hypothetical protein JXM70_13550 [Pirellulales bacterium]|nr:hypothetical protein [Pirellulales bacterium]